MVQREMLEMDLRKLVSKLQLLHPSYLALLSELRALQLELGSKARVRVGPHHDKCYFGKVYLERGCDNLVLLDLWNNQGRAMVVPCNAGTLARPDTRKAWQERIACADVREFLGEPSAPSGSSPRRFLEAEDLGKLKPDDLLREDMAAVCQDLQVNLQSLGAYVTVEFVRGANNQWSYLGKHVQTLRITGIADPKQCVDVLALHELDADARYPCHTYSADGNHTVIDTEGLGNVVRAAVRRRAVLLFIQNLREAEVAA